MDEPCLRCCASSRIRFTEVAGRCFFASSSVRNKRFRLTVIPPLPHAIISSLSQEESRSISENVTWGQRKRFADGKVSLPYKNFLGYDRGENKDAPPVV